MKTGGCAFFVKHLVRLVQRNRALAAHQLLLPTTLKLTHTPLLATSSNSTGVSDSFPVRVRGVKANIWVYVDPLRGGSY